MGIDPRWVELAAFTDGSASWEVVVENMRFLMRVNDQEIIRSFTEQALLAGIPLGQSYEQIWSELHDHLLTRAEHLNRASDYDTVVQALTRMAAQHSTPESRAAAEGGVLASFDLRELVALTRREDSWDQARQNVKFLWGASDCEAEWILVWAGRRAQIDVRDLDYDRIWQELHSHLTGLGASTNEVQSPEVTVVRSPEVIDVRSPEVIELPAPEPSEPQRKRRRTQSDRPRRQRARDSHELQEDGPGEVPVDAADTSSPAKGVTPGTTLQSPRMTRMDEIRRRRRGEGQSLPWIDETRKIHAEVDDLASRIVARNETTLQAALIPPPDDADARMSNLEPRLKWTLGLAAAFEDCVHYIPPGACPDGFTYPPHLESIKKWLKGLNTSLPVCHTDNPSLIAAAVHRYAREGLLAHIPDDYFQSCTQDLRDEIAPVAARLGWLTNGGRVTEESSTSLTSGQDQRPTEWQFAAEDPRQPEQEPPARIAPRRRTSEELAGRAETILRICHTEYGLTREELWASEQSEARNVALFFLHKYSKLSRRDVVKELHLISASAIERAKTKVSEMEPGALRKLDVAIRAALGINSETG